jgi:hypothetical protein
VTGAAHQLRGTAARHWLRSGVVSVRVLKRPTATEVRRVDITMKLNVLAVCAAFVFVGAIVLGAF